MSMDIAFLKLATELVFEEDRKLIGPAASDVCVRYQMLAITTSLRKGHIDLNFRHLSLPLKPHRLLEKAVMTK